tara:strand:- start:7846 stop:9198 length:1353 start_codon:yes stop_codon:yes gene_type:complete
MNQTTPTHVATSLMFAGLAITGCAAPHANFSENEALHASFVSNEEAPLASLRTTHDSATPLADDSRTGRVNDEDSPVLTMDARGFQVTSADGTSSMRIGGRLQTDFNVHGNEGAFNPAIQDGSELRRARLEMRGTLPDDLIWAAEADFGSNKISLKDFWVGRHEGDGPTITFGHQKQPYSLDVEMSSNDIPFVERGVDTALVIPFVDRAIGLRAQNNSEDLYWAVGLFGEGATKKATADEGFGFAGRLVSAPVQTETEVLHLGVRGAWRRPEDGPGGIRIRDETTNMSNFSVVDTGTLMNVDSVSMYGAEAAWARGPFSIGGEFNSMMLDRMGGDLNFSSWHVQSTYSLTGESRAPAYRIDQGEFKRLRGEKAGDRPWEVSARLASIDLNDGAFSGGAQDAFSLGLNWYYNNNVRLMWGYTTILDTSGGSLQTMAADGLDIFTFRMQFIF